MYDYYIAEFFLYRILGDEVSWYCNGRWYQSAHSRTSFYLIKPKKVDEKYIKLHYPQVLK